MRAQTREERGEVDVNAGPWRERDWKKVDESWQSGRVLATREVVELRESTSR